MTLVNTFPLVWCEDCGKATDPPRVSDLGLVGGAEPIKCAECGAMVTLLRCAIHPRTESWQAKPGGAIRYVATLNGLSSLPSHSQISVSGGWR